jgi:hypothetical protein
MSGSNAWAEWAALYCRTRAAYLQHEAAKAELKALMPEDAREAVGHGVEPSAPSRGRSRFEPILNGGGAVHVAAQ